jgi:hypothetical protein
MDLVREASLYATQLDDNILKHQAEQQLILANVWLNFVRKKKATSYSSKQPATLPMWLLPGVHFLRYICSLHFTNRIDTTLFNQFYDNMQHTFKYLYNTNDESDRKQSKRQRTRPKKSSEPLIDRSKSKTIGLSQIDKLDKMDRRIDRQRFKKDLIGRIIEDQHLRIKMPTISIRMEQDLASMIIRNFYTLNLLSCGQYSTSKLKCNTIRSKHRRH